jgi:hypothetical protein
LGCSPQQGQGRRGIALGQCHGAKGRGDLDPDGRCVVDLGDARELIDGCPGRIKVTRRDHDGNASGQQLEPLEPTCGLGERSSDTDHGGLDVVLS